jgi:hypothetical protein
MSATHATHAVVVLSAALAEADELASPDQRRNTDGLRDLRRQLPRALARLSPEARATLARYVDGLVDPVALANLLETVKRAP